MTRNYYTINEETQRQAKAMISFSDYEMGSATASYKASVNKVYDYIEENITDSDGKAKALYYADKFSKGLAEWYNNDARITLQCPSVMISGPANFPVKKKERQINAWHANNEFMAKVDGYKDKIRNIARGHLAIMSDDDKAIEKLEKKIAALKEQQELMRNTNKAIRLKDTTKGNTKLHDLGYTDKEITELRKPDMFGCVGFATYQLTNNNANIHRLEERLNSLKAEKAHEQKEDDWQNPFFKVVENKEIMRIQLIFDGKPDEETRSLLKHNGFRWSPHYTAWQRQLNDNGRRAVRYVLEEMEKK